MRVMGLAGWSGAGKTTLLDRLIPALIARGLVVSTLKHAHHNFDVDQPGTDTWMLRQAGANEVIAASPGRWALIHELRDAAEPPLPDLLARMTPGRSGADRRLQTRGPPEDRDLPSGQRETAIASRQPVDRRGRRRYRSPRARDSGVSSR